jgi:HAD superfamily hydrolase (TIGR01509 family)
VHATVVPPATSPDWAAVDTICLDMDGTVLDLSFDNLFWLEVLPRRWAAAHGVPTDEAVARLQALFDAKRGTLEWYCIDHWSEQLDFDVAALKAELGGHVRYLPGALEFLDATSGFGKRRLLTTNAHPTSLAVKGRRTGLAAHFDALVSSHEFGVPKEEPAYWRRLAERHAVDPGRTLFVDDSPAVLAAARVAGVRTIFQLRRPDSTLPPRPVLAGFAAIETLAELLD